MSHRYRSRMKRTLLVAAALLLLGTFAVQTEISGKYRMTQVVAAQASDGVLAVVGANGASLHDRPAGDVVLELGIGTTLTAVGRTGDSRWVMVMTDGDDVGWAEADDLVLFGIAELPVLVDEPATAETKPTAIAEEEGMDEEDSTDGEDSSIDATPTKAPTDTPTPVPPTATPTNSPTPTPSPTPVPPTATFTPTPAPTATPAPARSSGRAVMTVVAVAGSGGATLYDGPDGAEQYTLATGTAMTADARSEDGEWVSIQTATDDIGWVAVDDVVIFNVVSLPVVEEVAAMAEAETANGEAVDADMAGDGMAGQASDDQVALDEVTAAEEVDQVSADDAAPTETPAEEAEPTATPTAKPTSRATPRPTPVVDEGDITASVILTGSRLNVRSGPGTDYRIVAKAYPDEVFLAIGRNETGDWIQIEVPELDGVGWVSAELVRTSELIVDLPVTDGDEVAGAAGAGMGANQMEAEPSILPSPTPEPEGQIESTTKAMSTGPTGLNGKLAITTGGAQGDIYLYDLATGTLRFITKGYEPEMSRDGSSIIFTRYGNEPGVHEINLDGSGERRISGEGQATASPKMSPDGNWIVFSHLSGTYKCHNLGSFVGCVSEGRFCPSVFPNCLPDDLKIELPEFGLARVNLNGEEYRDIATLTTARAPDWNEAGIVYDSSTGIEIAQDKPDGETENVISERWYQDADWQPGGGRIIFQAREGSHFEIFSINPDGSGLTALTRPVTTLVENLPSNVSPAWSPDGQRIVYLSSRDDDNDRGDWRIWVMDADGSNQRPLPIDLPIEYGFAHEQMVGWGP